MMRKFSREWKASRTPRPAIWAQVSDEQWYDWRWQLSHRLNTLEELQRLIHLTPEEVEGIATHRFRLDITPYFASLIDPNDPLCPVRQQVIPKGRELAAFTAMTIDALAEDAHSPVPGLVHRYPDRVLMMATTHCASYCRYCTRSRLVGDLHATFGPQDYDAQIDYIRRTPQVRDVLLSGGDPFTLSSRVLENLLARLRDIPHVEVIRIGTRVPVFLPMRINDALLQMIRRYHPVWVNIHVNHPREITPELCAACERMADAGIPLGNQSVLLAGINDSVHIQRQLVHELVQMRVRPYYLYQCDLVPGAGHFRTTVSKGIEIIEGLRGHTSGFAVPQYMIDVPGGGGKVPVGPNYLLSQSPGRVVLRNFEGYIATYTEPLDYDPTRIQHLEAQVARRPEPGQEGLTSLLEGHQIAIKPQGFDALHRRGRTTEHRLSANAHKWQPFGVGEGANPTEELNDEAAVSPPIDGPRE
ncbi:MAG: lysine 2,3-aminomutase [Anaerolineae bacterium]